MGNAESTNLAASDEGPAVISLPTDVNEDEIGGRAAPSAAADNASAAAASASAAEGASSSGAIDAGGDKSLDQLPALPAIEGAAGGAIIRNLGDYRLEKVVLGEGAFGKVRLATSTRTSHRVAVKVIKRKKLNERAEVLLQREVKHHEKVRPAAKFTPILTRVMRARDGTSDDKWFRLPSRPSFARRTIRDACIRTAISARRMHATRTARHTLSLAQPCAAPPQSLPSSALPSCSSSAMSAQLRHENIVRLHTFIMTPTKYYLVMEYCEGGDLLHYINGSGLLSDDLANTLFLGLVDGLRFCHVLGIHHRGERRRVSGGA